MVNSGPRVLLTCVVAWITSCSTGLVARMKLKWAGLGIQPVPYSALASAPLTCFSGCQIGSIGRKISSASQL